ncbi:MAG: stage V sporulation protein AD [Oscillospiraceae bacterium]|jgi:stage V sporulation protein AD|nr:stage V sporulation protein AD [Oscillospiraceae bacterium]
MSRIGKQTLLLERSPVILGSASSVGSLEASGPLAGTFDHVSDDAYYGQRTWEKAESAMQAQAFSLACTKCGVLPGNLDMVFAGDLLNQCTATALMLRETGIPFFGLYGACSTMAESIALAAMCINAGYANRAAAVTSSHFCTAERQFRMPLEYGGQRGPSSQWTATAAGAMLMGSEGDGARVTHVTPGKILDTGMTDSMNMGAAMAYAAFDTLHAHFRDLDVGAEHYDLIVTGDLAFVGHSLVLELFRRELNVELTNYNDCGLMLYSRDQHDINAGGSGCGCSAAVLCGYIMRELNSGRLKRVLFAGTGALMSAVSSGQGESIPGICHAVAIERS